MIDFNRGEDIRRKKRDDIQNTYARRALKISVYARPAAPAAIERRRRFRLYHADAPAFLLLFLFREVYFCRAKSPLIYATRYAREMVMPNTYCRTSAYIHDAADGAGRRRFHS